MTILRSKKYCQSWTGTPLTVAQPEIMIMDNEDSKLVFSFGCAEGRTRYPNGVLLATHLLVCFFSYGIKSVGNKCCIIQGGNQYGEQYGQQRLIRASRGGQIP